MFVSPAVSIFVISIIVMIGLLVLRSLEVSLDISLLRRIFRGLDPVVQRFVSRASTFFVQSREFILVHFFHISRKVAKKILRETMGQRDTVLEKLRGNTPQLAKEKIHHNVSPYLREISRIDRKEE